MFRLLLCALAAALFATRPATAFETRATTAWVYDITTQTVLMDKNGSAPVPPASMSKLMTINMLFEALADGRVTMQTTFGVSARAKARGGSTMFLDETDRPTVEDLIHGMIVNSGNDACIVVAEGLAGSEDAFAAQMTERARALGLANSEFVNASGWPDPGQRMSMQDLGLLGKRLIEVFPQYYPVFSETEFSYKNRAPSNASNRNPLLKLGIGADGLKTGHTKEAGYGMVGSVKQGERRIIFAFAGLTSDVERAEEAERIATWAFRQFAMKTVARTGVRVAEAAVFMGSADTVGLVPAQDIRLLIPALVHGDVQAEVVYAGPLNAPVLAGTAVAELVIRLPDMPEHRIPLLAETDVARGGFVKRLTTAARYLHATYIAGPQAS